MEATALLLDLQPGDEVILPSFTFVSTALPFLRTPAHLRFADLDRETLNISPESVADLLGPKTRALIVMHYGGNPCDMDRLLALQKGGRIALVEDAAHAMGATYRGRPLGAVGDVGILSFDPQKNVSCGEGGALCVNRPEWDGPAGIICALGTNREAFERGEVSEYTWVGPGIKAGLAESAAHVLVNQLEHLDTITRQRRAIWRRYAEGLRALEARGDIRFPKFSEESNGHLFYFLASDPATRNDLLAVLNREGIEAKTHYSPLHLSPVSVARGWQAPLENTEWACRRIIRLPLHNAMTEAEQARIIESVERFFGAR